VGDAYPFSGEKLSLVLTLYKAADFSAAKVQAAALLAYQGAGHSLGIHTQTEARPLELGLELPACRIIVNQAHCFANGGNFDNGMPFSLSMGCGTWGGNSISDNLNFRHFINTVRVVRAIPAQEPTIEDIYSDYPD
jgi:sulfoacetaldehyde dehydrogenase